MCPMLVCPEFAHTLSGVEATLRTGSRHVVRSGFGPTYGPQKADSGAIPTEVFPTSNKSSPLRGMPRGPSGVGEGTQRRWALRPPRARAEVYGDEF